MKTSGNTILITGGTSGIGLGFAEKFLSLGNKVIICGRREDRLKQIQSNHPEMGVKKCDVTVAAQREDLFKWIVEHYPDTNILINNAGVQLLGDFTKPIDMDRLNTEVTTNFIAPIHLSSLFAKHLSGKPEAAIINISSGLAFAPLAFMGVYCATKAAVHSITMSLRHQLKKTSVKVFEIVPPAVDTELGGDRRDDSAQSHGGMLVAEFVEEVIKAIENNIFEAAIGQAAGLLAKREELFEMMNNR
jgi:uncharacterized oxidoreductase